MSDSVDPMNSSQPLGQLPKPVTSMPALAKIDTERHDRTPGTALEKIRDFVPRSSRMPDEVFRWIIVLCAVSVFAIVVLVVWELVDKSRLSLHQFGLHFFYGHDWDPVNESFGAMPFIYGTLVSSFLALLLAVPLSIGVAVFVTEMCPQRLRSYISFLVELLAAIPSVIYGCGESSSWLRCCAITLSPSWRRPSVGQDFSTGRCTELACWPRASFSRS